MMIDIRGEDAGPSGLCLSALILWCLYRLSKYLGQREELTEDDYYFHPTDPS
jgi:hypothetical protein